VNDSRPGDTTRGTVERGPVAAGGWHHLQLGPGEERSQPVPEGEVLACIWHLSDIHLCDAESPARLEYLDRYSDPDSPYREELGDIGTYRPQESLTVQVAVTMIETVNRLLVGPATGAAIDTVLVTGDVTDNAQQNELSWYQTLLEGGVVSPRSGAQERSSWVGASDAATWDERYWHPDGPPPGVEPDRPTRIFGYPAVPGLVEAARRDVVSPGLALPWLTVYGNHDGLLQGTVAPDAALRELAVGAARVIGLPAGADPMVTAEAIAEAGPARYVHDGTSPRTPIAPDADRDFVTPVEFARTTRPTDPADADEPTYYAVDVGRLRVICLDTVNPHGGWQGSLGEGQYAWLVDELDAAADRYVVIASHHPSPTLTNDYRPDAAEPRVLGAEIVTTLLERPNVIAWIAGHVHFHAALWHGEDGCGFWELTTASLIDWPQQARILEFVRVSDAGRPEIAIVSTVVDHEAPPQWHADALDDAVNLAAISRSLAANDYRLRETSLRGLRLDSAPDVRNVVWRMSDPFA
jgi:metallophosphoesterase (TIGR03767 family)